MPSSKENLPTRPVGKLQLRIGYWLVTHRLQMKQAVVALLACVSVAFYGYSFWGVIDLARSQQAFEAMLQELSANLIDYAALRSSQVAQPLSVSPAINFPSVGNFVDLAAYVTNPNQKFAVPSFRYRFLQGGKEIGSGTSFLLPGEGKYVFRFAASGASGDVRVELSDVQWKRVRPEFAVQRAEKLRLEISGVEQVSGSDLGAGASPLGGQTRFVVHNRATVGYWDVGLYVLLKNGERLVGAQYTQVSRLDPDQKRRVTVNWPRTALATDVTVVPEVNLFDAKAFYRYDTGTEGEPR